MLDAAVACRWLSACVSNLTHVLTTVMSHDHSCVSIDIHSINGSPFIPFCMICCSPADMEIVLHLFSHLDPRRLLMGGHDGCWA
jgi:hypothetical protein